MDQERSKRRMRIEVLPEVDEHVALRLVQRLQHSLQVSAELYFGIDGGKEITKVSSLQHALFSVEDNWNTSSEFQKGAKEQAIC